MSNLLLDEQPLYVSPTLAKAVGLNESIVLQQIHYWLENNKKNGRNFFERKYWTYKSISNWHKEYFAFWCEKTVKRTFTALEKKGILLTGNYNKSPYDKTKWYTINYDLLNSLTSQSKITDSPDREEQIDSIKQDKLTLSKGSNCPNIEGQIDPIGEDELTQPIPDINKDIKKENKDIVHSEERTSETAPIEPIKTKPQTKDIDNAFECLWALYPKKRGKGQISHTTKKRLYDIGIDEIRRCIERYSTYCQDKDMQFWQNGSTFFSSGYIDYLDANYVDIEPPVVVVQRIHVDN